MKTHLDMGNKSTIKHATAKRIIILSSSLLFFSLTYILLSTFPSVGNEFDYWNMAPVAQINNLGHFDIYDLDAGFYVLTYIISSLCNITLLTIPLLPLQLIPLFMLSLAILLRINNGYIVILLLLLGIIGIGFPGTFMWWPHGVGAILFLTIVVLILLRGNNQNVKMHTTLCIILSVITLNYISYKLTFLSIALIVTVHLFEVISNRTSKVSKYSLLTIGLICIIYILTFNQMIYNTLLPRIRILDELSSISGIERFLAPLFKSQTTSPLASYYKHNIIEVSMINAFVLGVLILFIIISVIIILNNIWKKKELSSGEIIVSAIVLSSTLILIIYDIMGVAELGLIPFAGLISIALIYGLVKRPYKIIIISIIFLMISVSAYAGYATEMQDGIYKLTDKKYYNNIVNSYIYYKDNIQDDYPNLVASDVLSTGYYMMKNSENGIPVERSPRELSRDETLMLLDINEKPIDESMVFIVNYRLSVVTIRGWERIEGWDNNIQSIQMNKQLIEIYSIHNLAIYSCS